MQEINPSVKNSLIETSNHLNDVATIYNKVIDEAKTRIITPEGIRIDALLDEPAPDAFLFETLHPLGFNSAQIKRYSQFASRTIRETIRQQRMASH